MRNCRASRFARGSSSRAARATRRGRLIGVKRLLHILTRALIALSLLACIAAAALWMRSYWGTDYLSRATPVLTTSGGVIAHHENKISCTRGTMRFSDGGYQVYFHLTEPIAA